MSKLVVEEKKLEIKKEEKLTPTSKKVSGDLDFTASMFINLFETLNPEYFLDQNGIPKVTFRPDDTQVTLKINSSQMRSMISRLKRSWNLMKSSSTKIEEVISEMTALAIDSGKIYFCSIRCHKDNSGDVIIQLHKNKYCKIKSDGSGYTIMDTTDLKFDWHQKQLDLPIPVKISNDELIQKLLDINNFEKDNDIYLLLAFIIKSLVIDSGANPIAVLQGAQGSSKSTSSNNIKKLIDPTMPLLISPPKNESDVLISSNSGYFIAYDNLSGLSSELADVFCRLSTGGGISKRALYTDDDEKSYNLLKSILFNGIDEASVRPDFNDRAIIFHLKRIPSDKRISEIALSNRFNENYPKILGGLYHLLSQVLKELPFIRTEGLPRMTEFARFGIALEKVLKLEDGFFLKTFEENIREKIESNFWNDEVCNALYVYFYNYDKIPVQKFEKKPVKAETDLVTGEYYISGTAEELRAIFSKTKDRSSNIFPKTAKGFSEQLKRIEPLLNGKNIRIERDRTSHRRDIRIFAKISDQVLEELKKPFLF